MMVRTLTLDHLIERNAYLYPQHPALLIDGRVITHAQMAERRPPDRQRPGARPAAAKSSRRPVAE